MRKHPLSNGSYYHIFNRSIAKFEIFNSADDYHRFLEIINLYHFANFYNKYSGFLELSISHQRAITSSLEKSNNTLVEIIAFCIMPTHIHLILKQVTENGISRYMAKVLDSYSRYFNIKHQRKGPLWEGHFENILVKTDEQILHLTRYLHLNPTSAGLVKKPEDWQFSSYHQYVSKNRTKDICQFNGLIDLDSKEYKQFVQDHAAYQKEISKIKHLLFERYAG